MTTKLQAAFERAGYGRNATELLVALSKFQNNGGTYKQALELVTEAFCTEMPGRGHMGQAKEGRLIFSPSRQPNGGGEGHDSLAQKGHNKNAPSSPQNGGGGGQSWDANNGQTTGSSPPSPHAGQINAAEEAVHALPASGAGAGQSGTAARPDVRTPAPRPMSESRRNAMVQVGKQRARSFWDEEIGGVKRRVGSLTKFDIIQIKRRSLIDGHIADRLLTEIEWPDQDTTPLEKIGRQDHVKEIIGSAAKALEALHA